MGADPLVPTARGSLADRVETGRAARKALPRTALAEVPPPGARADPVLLIERQEQRRYQPLIPVRHERMAVSSFGFFRGTALLMGADLAAQPSTGLLTQLCGDAHLANFGLFASRDRRVVFDVNDFDETFRGSFEWDAKRLATSFVLAARTAALPDVVAREAAYEVARAYRTSMRAFAMMPVLGVWYERMEADQVTAIMAAAGPSGRRAVRRGFAAARARDSWSAIRKLTREVDGRRVFRDEPELTRLELAGQMAERVDATFASYRSTLDVSRRELLDRFADEGEDAESCTRRWATSCRSRSRSR
ncbi:DUF2252 family protein [Compostimonas suwonensis]|uniref:Uncharacterized protein DUF2252 n=1 Tax=Compostimonas suwonensis TaxID=1048394 RepID=A0A2M9BVQ2_9MICO|nr:DUF2252 family protein [Compostimonas suwonensis]PJJ62022.1 uncharacterized protein DUF2252 [Compostimonas suwonensis]